MSLLQTEEITVFLPNMLAFTGKCIYFWKKREVKILQYEEKTCLKFVSLTFSVGFYLFFSNMSPKANTLIDHYVG